MLRFVLSVATPPARLRRLLALGLALTAGLTLATGFPGAARANPLKKLETADDSKGWEAVGRLDLGGTGFCTASLIAPDLVLTAAHCLYERGSGQPVAITRMEFRAGWRNGRAIAYRKIRRAATHPDYLWTPQDDAARVPTDIALLELDQPIRLPSVAPYATAGGLRPGDEVGVVSYARERSEAASLQEICHVLQRHNGLLVLSCDVDFGSSGAPVFTLQPGAAPQIVSVIAAKAELDGRKIALGSDLTDRIGQLKAELSNEIFFRRPAGSLPQMTDAEKRSTGPKFLQPGQR